MEEKVCKVSRMVLTMSFVGRVLVMYCLVSGIAESKICIEQQIMFLCDCKCAVHLTQLSNAGVLKPVADDDMRVVVAPEEEPGEVDMDVDAGAKAKPKPRGKAKARRGRKTVLFEKCTWVEVSARPQALTLVTRLLLTADDFH